MAHNDSVYLCPKANGNWCYLPDEPLAPSCLRTRLIEHLINMKKLDIEYAREAFKFYDALLPWMELGQGVKEAMK